MKKGKGTFLRRMAAVLLAAVLVTGMMWDAAPMTVLAEEGVANATLNVTLRVYGYDETKWRDIVIPFNHEVSRDCEKTAGQGYTDLAYTFGLNMKSWENIYIEYSDYSPIYSDTVSPNQSPDWGTVNVWPVCLMDGEEVFDIIYVGDRCSMHKVPETTPEKSGYTFEGWKTSDGQPIQDEFGNFAQITGETRYYAAWTQTDEGKVAEAAEVVADALAKINATNDTESEEVQEAINNALSEAGITDVTASITTWNSSDKATTSHEGKITVWVNVHLASTQEYQPPEVYQMVKTELIIPKLPDTPPVPEEKYAVTVNDGTGGGEYEAGATVTITANAPASGKQFEKWTVTGGSVTLADAASSTTTFTMPAEAVSVTATYKEATGTEPGTGTVTPGVEQGAGAPTTNISTPAAELEDMLLTEEEKQQVQNGTDVRLVLKVQDAGSTVSDSDKNSIQQALNGFTVGRYLNIDLYKLVGTDRTNITETTKKIRIVIAVPDSLKNTDSGKTRTFSVIRVHDGRAEFLNDMDDNDDTVTIETDRFSSYAIVYKDSTNGANGGNNDNTGGNNGGGDNSGNTGDNDNTGGNNTGSSNNGGNNTGGNNTGSNNGGGDTGGNTGGSNNGNSDNNNNNGNNDNTGGSNNGGNNNNNGGAGGGSGEKDNEPKTGERTPLMLYATAAMIAGFTYLRLYFAEEACGMTEEKKRELVAVIAEWAKRGGMIRRLLALSAIFVLLVYYHGTKKLYRNAGGNVTAGWKEVYGK